MHDPRQYRTKNKLPARYLDNATASSYCYYIPVLLDHRLVSTRHRWALSTGQNLCATSTGTLEVCHQPNSKSALLRRLARRCLLLIHPLHPSPPSGLAITRHRWALSTGQNLCHSTHQVCSQPKSKSALLRRRARRCRLLITRHQAGM